MFLSEKTLQQQEVLQPDHSSRSGALGEVLSVKCTADPQAPHSQGGYCTWGRGVQSGAERGCDTLCTHSVPGLPHSCLSVKVPHRMDKETEAHRAKITGHPTSQVAELGLTPRPVAPG